MEQAKPGDDAGIKGLAAGIADPLARQGEIPADKSFQERSDIPQKKNVRINQQDMGGLDPAKAKVHRLPVAGARAGQQRNTKIPKFPAAFQPPGGVNHQYGRTKRAGSHKGTEEVRHQGWGVMAAAKEGLARAFLFPI